MNAKCPKDFKQFKWARSAHFFLKNTKMGAKRPKKTKKKVRWARSAQKSKKTYLNGREAPEIFGTHGLILVPVVLVLVPPFFWGKKVGTPGFWYLWF